LRIHCAGGKALLDQDLRQVGVAAVFRDARHVVEELLLGVGAEVGARDLVGREVDQLGEVLDAPVGDADQPGGEARVAAGLLLRGSLQDQDPFDLLAGREGCAKGGVAAADDHHVVHQSAFTPAFSITFFQRACSLAM
jgi:hypothetical protein